MAVNPEFHHIPVLAAQVVSGLAIQPGGHYLDATLGGGGHSECILATYPDVQVTAIDRDAEAIAYVQSRLGPMAGRLHLWQGNFADYQPLGQQFHGIVADLGVSSHQLDQGDRGFSFRQPAPLDMRMDQQQELTAATIINHWPERQLADLLYEYGEERFSRRIAKAISQNRPLWDTITLAELISRSVPPAYRYGRIHPATRTFQALRIAVNQELTSLEKLLCLAPQWLYPGGRLVVISFHSLEDRIVKQSFRGDSRWQIVTKKPLVPTEAEVRANSRARSAKLRVAQWSGL